MDAVRSLRPERRAPLPCVSAPSAVRVLRESETAGCADQRTRGGCSTVHAHRRLPRKKALSVTCITLRASRHYFSNRPTSITLQGLGPRRRLLVKIAHALEHKVGGAVPPAEARDHVYHTHLLPLGDVHLEVLVRMVAEGKLGDRPVEATPELLRACGRAREPWREDLPACLPV
jgi:hypothetical protein